MTATYEQDTQYGHLWRWHCDECDAHSYGFMGRELCEAMAKRHSRECPGFVRLLGVPCE